MTNGQRILRVAMLMATLFSAQGSRVGRGVLGRHMERNARQESSLAHLGFDREREGRRLHGKGASFDVQFTKVTPTSAFFGDKANYTVTLTRSGDTTASAKSMAVTVPGQPCYKGLKRRQYSN